MRCKSFLCVFLGICFGPGLYAAQRGPEIALGFDPYLALDIFYLASGLASLILGIYVVLSVTPLPSGAGLAAAIGSSFGGLLLFLGWTLILTGMFILLRVGLKMLRNARAKNRPPRERKRKRERRNTEDRPSRYRYRNP